MAGEWIKVELATADKPELMRIARLLGIDRDMVFGKLIRLWAWFDKVSVDGRVDGVLSTDVDSVCNLRGFADALVAVGWLGIDDRAEKVWLPNFDRHNGETAKNRGLKNRRQAQWRKNVDAPPSTPPSTQASTREEKRREEVEAKPSQASACPQAAIIDLYHELLPACQKVKAWTGKRETHLRSRWREDAKRQDLAYWRRLFLHCAKSEFLMGRTATPGRAPFVFTLAWLVNPENFAKVIEGNYHDRG